MALQSQNGAFIKSLNICMANNMTNSKLLIGLFLIIGFSIGFLSGAIKWRREGHMHIEVRETAILAQARQMQSGGVLVLGDSLTEFAKFDSLCGLPALNAGIGGATTDQILEIAPDIIDASRPKIIFVAIGNNDSDTEQWREHYRNLLALAKPDVVVGLTDNPQMTKFISEQKQVHYVKPMPLNAENFLPDNLHHTAEGSRQYISNLESACDHLQN